MPTSLPQHDPGSDGARKLSRPSERGFQYWTLAVPAALAVLTGVVPAALVLPALSIVLVLLGGAVTGWGWVRQSMSPTQMDLAGALLLVGFGASMLADMPEALKSLAELQEAMRGRSG